MRRNTTAHTRFKIFRTASLILLIVSLLLSGCNGRKEEVIDVSGQDFEFEDKPCTRSDGEPFHLAFMDLGPAIESSYLCLKGFVEGLQNMGYISEGVDLSKAPQDFYEYYDYMMAQDLGPYVVFDDKPYMIGEGNDDAIAEKLLSECKENKLDMVVATGTDPGLFLKDLGLDIPFLVCLATDPIASGIIDSVEDTGNDNIWALVEPVPYRRQFEGYRNMIGFRKLCMVTVDGMDEITGNPLYREMAKELGVEVNEINFSEEDSLKDDYDEQILNALKSADLSDTDAILFAYGTMDDDNAPTLSEFAAKQGIPSLIGDGDSICENGGMMCLSCFDYEGYGAYAAMVASNVFHGQKAKDQPCVYTSSPHVVLNMTTAEQTGYFVTFDLLQGIDRIYR